MHVAPIFLPIFSFIDCTQCVSQHKNEYNEHIQHLMIMGQTPAHTDNFQITFNTFRWICLLKVSNLKRLWNCWLLELSKCNSWLVEISKNQFSLIFTYCNFMSFTSSHQQKQLMWTEPKICWNSKASLTIVLSLVLSVALKWSYSIKWINLYIYIYMK